MLYTLENAKTRMIVSSRGAELHALTDKATGVEYLWNGDPAYWKYHAPLLFPIVGRVAGNRYRVDGESYELPAHGLARVSEFDCSAREEGAITFTLRADEASLKAYPYRFALHVTYTLLENGVKTALRVENEDTRTMYFSIGSHPAFLCPIDPAKKLEDYYLAFSEKETAPILPVAPSGFLSREKRPCLQNEDKLALKKELFANDALIFQNLQSKTIAIKCKDDAKFLTISVDAFPFVGIWAPKDGAPFLCIEPWFGHTDFEDFDGEFKDKEDNVALAAGEDFSCAYTVTITA